MSSVPRIRQLAGVLTASVLTVGSCGSGSTGDDGSAPDAEAADPADSGDGHAADVQTFAYDGAARQYLMHAPSDLPEGAPLVFMLHGYGSSPQAARERTGFDAAADASDFAVVYPQGSADYDGRSHWNARMRVSETDDVGFLSALARHLQEEHDFSGENTFATGFSNGGSMSYVLAMDAPDVFRAAASVTGTMNGAVWESRSESRARFPLLQVSGRDDKVIAFDGTPDLSVPWGGAPSMERIIDHWSEHNACASSDTAGIGLGKPDPGVLVFLFQDCEDGVEVWHLVIDGFGHDWPAEDNRAGVDGALIVWDFFSRFVV